MAMDGRAFIELQLEALSIRYFIGKYDVLEKMVKLSFSQHITAISAENKNLLYFYLGGIKSNTTYIDYENSALKIDKSDFLTNEKFGQLSMSQIIKIQRRSNLIDGLNFNVPSINKRSTEYTFADCCIKLLNMRNKLAHQITSLDFTDKDIIELFSNEYISKNSSTWFETLDTELMNDETRYIFSNCIMLDRILLILHEREDEPDYEH